MPTKSLHPVNDLLFTTNSMVGSTPSSKSVHHLHKRGGKEIADQETKKLFGNAGLHVCGINKKIEEKFEAMSQAALDEDWIAFETHVFELKKFKPSQKCLDFFGRALVKETVSRNPSVQEIETLRRKLSAIGISDRAMDEGYEEGYNFLFSSIN